MTINADRSNRGVAATALAAILTVASADGALAEAGRGASAGSPGSAANASRTVTIVLRDNYFEPETLSVAFGETVRFVVKNAGSVVHEFNIGTPDMHAAHQAEMMMMVDHGVLAADKINHAAMSMPMADGSTMEHNDPNSALLEPGKSAEVIWKFDVEGEIEFACNVPGHYDSGMVGAIAIKK